MSHRRLNRKYDYITKYSFSRIKERLQKSNQALCKFFECILCDDVESMMEMLEQNRIKVNDKAADQLVDPDPHLSVCPLAGITGLHLAAGLGNLEICELLIKNGAKVNEKSLSGETPLHFASRKGHLEVCDSLLMHEECRKSINEECWVFRKTALHWACDRSESDKDDDLIIDLCCLLLENGADPHARSTNGWKPITDMFLKKPKIQQYLSHEKRIKESLGKGFEGEIVSVDDHRVKKCFHGEKGRDGALREYDIAKDLNHKNVINVSSLNLEDPSIYMEKMDGNLKDFYENNELSLHRKMDIAIQIAEGLAYIHEKKVIHNDIKSLNILYRDGISFKIADFGAAEFVNDHEELKGKFFTLGYRSPERIKKESFSYPSDIYSFGITLNELFNEDLPIKPSSTNRILQTSENQNIKIWDEVPQVKNIIADCIRIDPNKRPSANKVVQRLKDVRWKILPVEVRKLFQGQDCLDLWNCRINYQQFVQLRSQKRERKQEPLGATKRKKSMQI